MVQFNKETFKDTKILVIGDAMLDRYFFGKVERRSPEADVPVVDVNEIENKLGGAANVALNIQQMNSQVELICCIGDDKSGLDFLKALDDNKIISDRIVVSKERHTTLKGRVYNNNEYLLRLDRETIYDFDNDESYTLLQNIKQSIDKFKPDVAILQDYNKGLFTASNIADIIELLQNNNIKIAVDPKKDNFLSFKNVDLFKPNLKEISEALETRIDTKSKKELESICKNLKEQINCKTSLITLSEDGVIVYDINNTFSHHPAFKRNVLDVSGAGDTVISVASLLLALDFPADKIAYYSNLAGGMTIEHKGVVALSIDEFVAEVNKL